MPQPLSTPASPRRGLEDFEPLLRGYVLAPGEGQLLLHLAGPEGTLPPPIQTQDEPHHSTRRKNGGSEPGAGRSVTCHKWVW